MSLYGSEISFRQNSSIFLTFSSRKRRPCSQLLFFLVCECDIQRYAGLLAKPGKLTCPCLWLGGPFVTSLFFSCLPSLMESLSSHCQDCDPMADGYWKVGKVCCAVFSEDGSWYRGRITSVNAENREADVSSKTFGAGCILYSSVDFFLFSFCYLFY